MWPIDALIPPPVACIASLDFIVHGAVGFRLINVAKCRVHLSRMLLPVAFPLLMSTKRPLELHSFVAIHIKYTVFTSETCGRCDKKKQFM